MSSDEQGYNGWANYATWGVALVLDNEESSYRHVRATLEGIRADAFKEQGQPDEWTEADSTRYRFAEFLKGYVEELCGLESHPAGGKPSLMARQVIQAGLAEVDWDEIARNIMSEE